MGGADEGQQRVSARVVNVSEMEGIIKALHTDAGGNHFGMTVTTRFQSFSYRYVYVSTAKKMYRCNIIVRYTLRWR